MFFCPSCGQIVYFEDVTIHHVTDAYTGEIKEEYICPHCDNPHLQQLY